VCDITYNWAEKSFLILTVVIGAWSRRTDEWSVSNTVQAMIAIDALTMAVKRGSPPISLMQHSDRSMLPYRQREERAAIFEWIEVWYQRIRIHGSLGYVSPEAFEATERDG
jgi:transposase InsO family protein